MLIGRLLVLLALGAAPATGATLTRAPYLQLPGPHGMTVVWHTDTPAACGLAVRPLDGAPTVLAGDTSAVCAITADGLAPGTAYAYAPLADGEPLTAETVFRTDTPGEATVFLVLGDSGSPGPAQLAVRDRMLAGPADFVLHTGDMVYDAGAAADFDPKFFTPYAPLLGHLVLWPSRGNHDVATADGAPWREAFWTPANNPAGSEDYYSFDQGPMHVVVLDSTSPTGPDSAQRDFLERDLATRTAAWTAVVFHHTIYSSGDHGSALRLRANLAPIFDRHHVDLVFMGHDHDYERTFPLRADGVVPPGAGTVYVTTGGGGRSIHAVGASWFTAYAESTFHFVRVAADADALRLQMIRADGRIGDETLLVKGTPPTPRCGDDLVDQEGERCDGADHVGCIAGCLPDCTCAPACGDGHVDEPAEACDGATDAACPGRCADDCSCADPADVIELEPEADTYVQAGVEATWDHGAARHLDVDHRPAGIAYLRFDLSTLLAPVRSATLVLHCTNPAHDGGAVYPVTESGWIEGTGRNRTTAGGPGLTWSQVDTNGDNRIEAGDGSLVPDLARPLATIGPVDLGATATAHLTAAAFQSGPGRYTLAIRNDDADGASYVSREGAVAAEHPRLRLVLAPPPPLDLIPVADTYVEAGAEAARDHGASDHLDVDNRPLDMAYLKFDLTGVGTPIARATLNLHCTNTSPAGGDLFPVPDPSWLTGLTWNDLDRNGDGMLDATDSSPWLPDLTRPIATLGPVLAGNDYTVDVTAAFQSGPRLYALAVRGAATDGATYSSSDHPLEAERPRLHLTFGSPRAGTP